MPNPTLPSCNLLIVFPQSSCRVGNSCLGMADPQGGVPFRDGSMQFRRDWLHELSLELYIASSFRNHLRHVSFLSVRSECRWRLLVGQLHLNMKIGSTPFAGRPGFLLFWYSRPSSVTSLRAHELVQVGREGQCAHPNNRKKRRRYLETLPLYRKGVHLKTIAWSRRGRRWAKV